MAKSPTCPLCSEVLVRESSVRVSSGSVFQRHLAGLAWVCPGCSAAFPIALAASEQVQPLYARGARADDASVPGADSVAL